MNYPETLEYLYSMLPDWHRIGKAAYKKDLSNSLRLDKHFGHPHRQYRNVHVAGTNGKGSVSHMTASVLQEAGVRTGLYTSPHLRDFRERIKVDGIMMPEEAVVDFVSGNLTLIESMKPSFFELTVAMAFQYFADSGAGAAVVETGLGGRLDSTNIIEPVLSVITNIGHDHMDLLGDTLVKVAAEKAGIIKPGVPVVVSETDDLTKEVFISRAADCGSRIVFADNRYECSLGRDTGYKGRREFKVTDRDSGQAVYGTVPLGGDYQSRNIQAVYAVSEELSGIFGIDEEKVLRGIGNVIANTGLMGRWQILGTYPLVICDTAHNREGLEYVLRQIASIPRNKLHIIMGFVNDKDLSMVLPLFPSDARYYFTKAPGQRALGEDVLMAEAGRHGLAGDSFPDVKTALASARMNASPADMIFIGGSTFIVAEVL